MQLHVHPELMTGHYGIATAAWSRARALALSPRSRRFTTIKAPRCSKRTSMSQDIHEGDKVAWNWGRGHAEGTVKEVHPDKVTIESKGKHITRNGEEDNPAVVIDTGKNPVVKKASELHVMGEGEEVSKGEHVHTAAQDAK